MIRIKKCQRETVRKEIRNVYKSLNREIRIKKEKKKKDELRHHLLLVQLKWIKIRKKKKRTQPKEII